MDFKKAKQNIIDEERRDCGIRQQRGHGEYEIKIKGC